MAEPASGGAVEPACVWAVAPKVLKDAVVAAGPVNDAISKAVSDTPQQVLVDMVAAAGAKCHLPKTDAAEQLVGKIVYSEATKAWALAQLKSNFGVTEAAIAAERAKLTPEARAVFTHSADTGTPQHEAQVLAMLTVAEALGLKKTDNLDGVIYYLVGCADLDLLEPH
ncbi:MAG: hypothetical protein ACHP7N_09585 [Caulobacterales bacterium]